MDSSCKSILYSQLKVYKLTKTSHMKYYFNFPLNYTSGTLNIQQIQPLRHHEELKLRNKYPISVGLSLLNFRAQMLKQAAPHIGHSEQDWAHASLHTVVKADTLSHAVLSADLMSWRSSSSSHEEMVGARTSIPVMWTGEVGRWDVARGIPTSTETASSWMPARFPGQVCLD